MHEASMTTGNQLKFREHYYLLGKVSI